MYKQKTKWAVLSVWGTLLSVSLLFGLGLYIMLAEKDAAYIAWILWGLLAVMCLSAMFFYPREIQIKDGGLNIVFPLRTRTFPLTEIAKAEPYQVTMNFVRICGSGGLFGWWGLFRNQELGRFVVYASELDHVFLVELNDGSRYVISCPDPETMCAMIRDAIRK